MKKFNKISLMFLMVSFITLAAPVGSRFSYQGQLQESGSPANGVYDFRMDLWSTETGGTTVSSPVDIEDVEVVNGLFSVELDFGDLPFNGEDDFLKIQVRDGASTGGYTALSPRQRINAVPYAIQSEFVENSASPWEIVSGGISYLDDVTIGVLTSSSPSKVTIAADSGEEPLRARIGGATRFLVTANSGVVIGTNGTSPDSGLYVEGDANQALASNGLIKAGLVVTCSNPSSITRSFNGVDDQSFAINGTIGTGPGVCAIDFPFSLDNRYFVAMVNSTVLSTNRNVACGVTASTTLICSVLNSSGTQVNAVIQILVY